MSDSELLWKRYCSDAYSLDFPDGWSLSECDDHVSIATPDDDLALTLQSFRGAKPIQRADLANLLEDFRHGRRVVSPPRWLESATCNGLEAELEAGSQDHSRTRWVFRAVYAGTRVVTVALNADTDTLDERRSTWEAVLNSLRVEAG
jgi:hypothetical protein